MADNDITKVDSLFFRGNPACDSNHKNKSNSGESAFHVAGNFEGI